MMKLLRNREGSIPFLAAFVLAIMVLLMCLMLWTTSQISLISVRNHIKEELANVSIRISEDTYTAMSEGNLGEYYRVLASDTVYQAELKQLVIDGITSAMDLETANYKVSDIDLTFHQNSDSIDYVLTCNVECYLTLLGDRRTIRAEDIVLTGSHKIKSY